MKGVEMSAFIEELADEYLRTMTLPWPMPEGCTDMSATASRDWEGIFFEATVDGRTYGTWRPMPQTPAVRRAKKEMRRLRRRGIAVL